MRATEILKQQHRMIDALFIEIEGGDADALEDLANVLAAHMTAEHELFYPAARAIAPATILENFEEHAITELALKRALAANVEDESFLARVQILKDVVQHHLRHEELRLFPEVDQAIDLKRDARLAARLNVRFEEALADGYEPAFTSDNDDTAADIAQSGLRVA